MPETDYPFNTLDSGSTTTGEKTVETPAAKVQVLYLPEEKVGDVSRYPFALIVSETGDETDADEYARWMRFKDTVGAVAVLMTPHKIEVV